MSSGAQRRRGPPWLRRKVNRRLRHQAVARPVPKRVRGALRTAARVALPSLLGGAAVLLLWGAGHYVMSGPYFLLRDVRTQGLQRVTRTEALDAARLHVGLTHLLGLEPERVAERIAELPWVAEAEVERQLPDQVTVRVRERVAAAVVMGMPGGPMLTDAYGARFAPPEQPSDLDLPAITGLDEHTIDARLSVALAAIREWRRQGVEALDLLSEVHVDPTLGVTLYTLTHGTAIRVGGDGLAVRLARVRTVLEEVRRRGERADYVLADDERDRDRIVVRAIAGVSPMEAEFAPMDAQGRRKNANGKQG